MTAMENGEEAMERLMEVAQQQQMLLHENRDHNIFLGSANNDDEPTHRHRGHRLRDGEVEHRVVGVIPEMGQEGEHLLHTLPESQPLRRRSMDRSHGGYYCLRSITSIYTTLSVVMACLALITSPFNVRFSFIRMSDNPVAQKMFFTVDEIHRFEQVVDAAEAKRSASLDGHGNLDNTILRKDGGWEAVVALSKAKPLLGEPVEVTSELEQHHPPSSFPWTTMLLNFASELQGQFTERFSFLNELTLEYASIQSQRVSKTLEQSPSEAESKLPNSSVKWTFPWEWMSQGANHKSGKANANSDQPSVNINTATSNRFGDVKSVSLYSILSAKFTATNSSKIQFLSTEAGDSATSKTFPQPTFRFTTIFNRMLTSTPRMMVMANLILVVVYLLQTAVVELFLGPLPTANVAGTNPAGQRASNLIPDEASRQRRAGRERLLGFTLYKLLLVSVVLESDTIDLFILISWYAFVSFLKSVSFLAGTTTNHATHSGAPPSPSALRLLLLVLVCDALAALGCAVALYDTGWNMLFLLTCDCIILGVDAVTFILRHAGVAREEAHRMVISSLEDRQLTLRASRMERLGGLGDHQGDEIASERPVVHDGAVEQATDVADDLAYEDELHHLDQAIESYESAHVSRLALIGTATFALQIFALCVSVTHLVHIWALHGAGFGLLDVVLSLQMHSAISLIGRRIVDRRNVQRVTREINTRFPEASDKDIRKAIAAGDVCCICLNSISFGSVKKVRCGHLFHANCLREVIERERSFAATKCPLCRAPIVNDRHDPLLDQHRVTGRLGNTVNNDVNDGGGGAGATNRRPAQTMNPGEQSLLRFSTENILPSWLPIPAFAFEVVRRDVIAEGNPHTEATGWQRFFRRGGQVPAIGNNQIQPQEQQEQETPVWRRLLILLGAIPMSPEDEAAALEQLVDMFPQYDRADLLRELRARRSAEAVAESILLGIFSGIPRGGGGVDL
ncbi:hypothetical protein ACHAXH_004691 [Discostella pseudostelligera]